MRDNLRSAFLPAVQVAIAIVLTMHNRLRPFSLEEPTSRHLDKQVCDGLNAPAALAREVLSGIAGFWWSRSHPVEQALQTFAYFALVAAVWYAVSLELGAKEQSILIPKRRMRKATDVVGIIFGITLGLVALIVIGQSGRSTLYGGLISIPYFIWAAVIVTFYLRDLKACLRAARARGAR